MTQMWRTIVLFYPVLDARYGSGHGRRRARRVMGREERDVVASVVASLPATVTTWSDGAAALNPLDIVATVRMGLHDRALGGDLRRRVLVHLHRSLALADH